MFLCHGLWGCACCVCGFGGCFVLVCLVLISFVVGVGLGLVWFSGLFVLTVALAWLHALLCGVGWGLICWFCLESLILAQDERWRRA